MMQKLISLLEERMPFRYYPVCVACGFSWMIIFVVIILGLNAIAGGHQPDNIAISIAIFLMNAAGYLVLILGVLPVIDLIQRVWFDYINPLRCGCGKS